MAGPEVAIALAASKALTSETSIDFFSKWELDGKLLSELETQVNGAKAVLNDAEMRQIVEGSFVDNWFQKARYAILDAEDLLDTILTDINKEKYRLGDSPGITSIIKEKLKYKGKNIIPFKKTREAKMRETIQYLQSIIALATPLNLDRNDGLTDIREKRISTSSDIHPSKIIGRSEDEKEILELLNSREGNDDALRVIPIVGMGGVGKTTLASLVYNGYETSDQSFQVKGWICFSDKFQLTRVIKSLLESITKGDAKASDTLEFLQNELKGVLKDKRFLLVLDDIWSDVENKWETLQTIFSVGAPGSRIIVTTREEKVAHIVSNSHRSSYELNGLSESEGWSLFQSHAFENGDSSAYPILENIGKEIVGKCKGSPLAIKMLGRVLFLKNNDVREWNVVLNSKIWNSTNEILPSLWLSYYHLPLPVKQCFAYFSIFPKDYSFSMEEMVILWVAEGFVEKPRESSSRSFDYEHAGRTYFHDLCSNFFIQKSTSYESQFVMHDLVHDLAEYVSKDLMVNLANINVESRRLSHTHVQTFLGSTRSVQKLSRLRTFLLGTPDYDSACYFDNNVCNDLFSNFKLLRVLSLERYHISELPASIGDMKLLRYLNLSSTYIEYLPQWICRLYNLQILQLCHCPKLKRLPASLCDLVNLRELNIQGTELKIMPDGIGRMTSLRKLPEFVLGEGNSKQMKEFKNLNNLHGSLWISGLNNVDDVEDVVTADFKNKKYLKELVLKWDLFQKGSTILEERVLDAMEPHKSLKRLTIQYYGGKRLPNWIVGAAISFTRMVFLRIYKCFNCEALPSIGAMPSLEHLSIERLDSLESLGAEFYGEGNPFPALQKLEIYDMEVLQTWSFSRGGKIGFSSLKELRIQYCRHLTEIPCCFPSLTTFEISECGSLRRLPFVGNFPFLKDIRIKKLDCLETLGPDFYGDGDNPFPALEALDITGMKVLKKWCFPGGDSVGFSSLKKLRIHYCRELTEIPYCFPRLIVLEINYCRNLVRLEMRKKGSESSSTIDGHSLHGIRIIDCHKLEEIPKSFVNLSKVTIDRCMSLVSVPELQHVQNLSLKEVDALLPGLLEIQNGVLKNLCIKGPSSIANLKLFSQKIGLYRFTEVFNLIFLTHLEIISCDDDLEPFLAQSPSELQRLKINQCNSLRTIPNRFLSGCSKHLENLELNNCPNLACLPDVLSALESLQKLRLESCPLIQHFPASSGLLFKSLRSLRIIDCPTLESLPVGFHNTTTLQKLIIEKCPDLVVPEDGFPAMINHLEIRNCGKMDPVSKLKLSKLTSLRTLDLQGFPKTITLDHCIPASIVNLRITDFPHLKSVSRVLRTLKWLDKYDFTSCPLLKDNEK